MARVRCARVLTAGRSGERGLADLLTRSGRGDVDAFLRLVDLAYPAVQAKVGGRARTAQGDDAVVAAFVTLWHCAPEFHSSGQGAVEWIMASVTARQPTNA